METPKTPSILLQLDPKDNVGVLIQDATQGQKIEVAGKSIVLKKDLVLGHKLATVDIAAGDKIFKYGCAIGSATHAIALGEHVHLHNIKSDYLPTHTLDEGQKYDR